MTAFLWCVFVYFLMTACLDLADMLRRNSNIDWLFLVFSTGMCVFAAQAIWERY